MKNKLIYIVGSTMVVGSLVLSGSAFAATRQTVGAATHQSASARVVGTPPLVFGTIAAVNGTSVTVTGKAGKHATTTAYTIDASAAKITKGYGQGAQSIGVANLAVGDMVAVVGAVTGNTVSATSIRDTGSATKQVKTHNGKNTSAHPKKTK